MGNFSKNLNKLRIKRNISIKALAKAIGVSASTISSWEKGKSKPRINHAIKIVQFFEISFKELLD